MAKEDLSDATRHIQALPHASAQTGKIKFWHASLALRCASLPFMISVLINGESRKFIHPLLISELVGELGLAGKRIAIERNGEIVPRGTFTEQAISDGDRIEIVVAVGGG